jgi:hypothetical protein
MGMSVSMSVVGIKPPDEKWGRYKHIWDACKAAGVEPPDEISDYFENEDPNEQGVTAFGFQVDPMYGHFDILPGTPKDIVVEQVAADCEYGYVIDLRRIPKDVQWLRITTCTSC